MNKKAYKSLLPYLYLLIVSIAYTIIFSAITIRRHQTLQTGYYDLGIIDQTLWNIINGSKFCIFNYGILSRNILHFSPILIFISPLYLILPDPKVLLVLQSFMLALGTIPLYLLAKKKLNDIKLALSLATGYLLSLHLHGVNLFDFHPVALVVPFLLFAFYFFEIEKYFLFSAFIILTFLCREEMLLIGFMIGLFVAIKKKKKWLGLTISILNILAFLAIAYIIFPYFTGGKYPFFSFECKYYKFANKDFYEIFKVIFMPHKIKYILSLLLPVMGFPLLSGWGLLLIIPQMAGVLLSSYRPLFTIGFFQYSAPIIPFIFILSVYGISKFRRYYYLISTYLIAAGLVLNVLWFSEYFYLGDYKITEHHRLISKIKNLIPRDASLIANNRTGAHFSQRKDIYSFENLFEQPDRNRTDRISDYNIAEYIIVDTKTFYKNLYEPTMNKLKEILSAKEYGVMYYEDGYVILKKGYNTYLNDRILSSH